MFLPIYFLIVSSLSCYFFRLFYNFSYLLYLWNFPIASNRSTLIYKCVRSTVESIKNNFSFRTRQNFSIKKHFNNFLFQRDPSTLCLILLKNQKYQCFSREGFKNAKLHSFPLHVSFSCIIHSEDSFIFFQKKKRSISQRGTRRLRLSITYWRSKKM